MALQFASCNAPPSDWVIGSSLLPPRFVLNVTATEFLVLQQLKARTTRTDGTLDRVAFYRRAGEILGSLEMIVARSFSTRLRVWRDCASLPTKRIPRIEELPLN